jgi:hypothetical protein
MNSSTVRLTLTALPNTTAHSAAINGRPSGRPACSQRQAAFRPEPARLGGTERWSAFTPRSSCQMPLCVGGAELVLLGEQGARGTVHFHRDPVERAGRRVMRKTDPHNVL